MAVLLWHKQEECSLPCVGTTTASLKLLLKPEEDCAVTGAAKAPEALAAATTSTVSSPEAKTSRLLPEQEQILLKFFGAQDKVDREEALFLAKQVGRLHDLSRLPDHKYRNAELYNACHTG